MFGCPHSGLELPRQVGDSRHLGEKTYRVPCAERATWGFLSYMQHRHFCGVLARGPDYHKVRTMRYNSSCVSFTLIPNLSPYQGEGSVLPRPIGGEGR